MNAFLEVFVALGTLIIVLLIASAITSAIFVVLSEFVRYVRARISDYGGLGHRFRADPNPSIASNESGALRNEARG
jgi:hypothetical protein